MRFQEYKHAATTEQIIPTKNTKKNHTKTQFQNQINTAAHATQKVV